MTVPALSDSLHRLMHVYRRHLRAGIEQRGIALPVTHIRVLKGVCRMPQCTAGSIALRMNQDKAQITRALNGLMTSGLIEKTENPEDRRSQFLVPTRAGRRMLSRIEAIESQAAATMTRNLSVEEVETFVRISRVMIENAAGAHPKDKEGSSNG